MLCFQESWAKAKHVLKEFTCGRTKRHIMISNIKLQPVSNKLHIAAVPQVSVGSYFMCIHVPAFHSVYSPSCSSAFKPLLQLQQLVLASRSLHL